MLKPHRTWLLELRRKENDLTLDAIAERLLRTHGVKADKVDAVALLCRRGDQLQKNRARQRTGRPDVAERREAWRRAQKNLSGRLIFLDET